MSRSTAERMVGVSMFSRLRNNIVVLWIVRLLALPVIALLDGSYAQAAASALVALLLCPFAAPMLLSLAGSALIVAASALFAWLF